MDAMALLCTLHADGPATLRLLRESGCTTLDTLRELGDERLAELLDVPPAAARRLLREAEALRTRMGDDLLEREEAPVEYAATRGAKAPTAESDELADDSGSVRRAGARLGPRDRELVQRVLTSWRERDAGDAGEDAEPARRVAQGVRPAPVVSERHDWLSRAAMRSPLPPPQSLVPATASRAPGPVRLVPGAVDGLTDDVARLLDDAGVHDLEALGRADVLALARSTGLAFTALQRLCFLARRSTQTTAARRSAQRPSTPPALAADVEERFSIADGPPRPEHGTLFSERDYELRPRPPAARSPRSEQHGPEVPGGPFA